MHKLPLIAKKTFWEFQPEEFHTLVKGMYKKRTKGKPKNPLCLEGISVTKTKTGKLSVRCTRPFKYILNGELENLKKLLDLPIATLWTLFKGKDYIIAKTKMEAEQINTDIQSIPW